MLTRKAVLWRAWKRIGSDVSKRKYLDYSLLCSNEIESYYRNKELRLIESNNVGKFCKYINGRLACKGRIPTLSNQDGSYAVNDLDKAELLIRFQRPHKWKWKYNNVDSVTMRLFTA